MRVLYFNEVTSTNAIARDLIDNDVCDICIMAKCQSHGRGRLNSRSWVSISGNLHATFVLNGHNNDMAELNYNILNAVKLELESMFPSCVFETKHPNDILLDGKKVCGVLIEMFEPYVLIGIGINTSLTPFDGAISISDKTDNPIDNVNLARQIFQRLKPLAVFEK